ncbi:MAG: FHA domain-containing protein [Immundisolibacteraceae bacterium]|nr:FHA domain-containing protein [Immundisolibacteraceae bacterium]
MSWIKKIIGKKGDAESTEGSSRIKPNDDETVLFGIEPVASPSDIPSRSSMISELAGLDPEASADLSNDFDGSPNISKDEPSSESINLDFDHSSDKHESSLLSQPDGTPRDFDSDQQETAIFNADQQETAIFGDEDLPAPPDLDWRDSSDQQKTAVFDNDRAAPSSAPESGVQPRAPATPPLAPPSLPELEFDSDSGLGHAFDAPLTPEPRSTEPVEPVEPVEPMMNTGDPSDTGTTSSGKPVSMIDQMAGGFDLDLGEAEESTSPAYPITPPPPNDPLPDASDLDETGGHSSPISDTPASDLTATAQGEDYFDQLATAKLDQPPPAQLDFPTEQTSDPEPAQESADNFDATVITTAASTPAMPTGGDYVTGWLVIVDGPGKGQSRPIRSGMNSLGRAPDQDIPLYFGAKSDGEISRRDHTRIVYDPRSNNFKLMHGASRNLTYLNDEAVLEITDLKAYDRIVAGKTTLLFLPLCGNIFRW